jgi:hypothetical protein
MAMSVRRTINHAALHGVDTTDEFLREELKEKQNDCRQPKPEAVRGSCRSEHHADHEASSNKVLGEHGP